MRAPSAADRLRGMPIDRHEITRKLRAMPIEERAEAIVGIFEIAASQFSLLVLEHTNPPKGNGKAIELNAEQRGTLQRVQRGIRRTAGRRKP